MPRTFTAEQLRRLRNEVDIGELIVHLGIPAKTRDHHLRFLCPHCSEFHTATNRETNLARCFRCKMNFNPIDIVMVVNDLSFVEAVHHLISVYRRPLPKPT